MLFGFYLFICLFGIKVTGINIRTICFQQKLYGFHEVKAFQLLDKTNDVATLAAAETLKHVQREIQHQRRCLLAMENATAFLAILSGIQ